MENLSLGKNGKIGKLNLSRIKAGVTKEDVAKIDKNLESVFDKIDDNKDGTLDRTEIDALKKQVTAWAGVDKNLEKNEIKDERFASKKDKKALLNFLNTLEGVTPEDVVKAETQTIDGQTVEVVTFKDNHTETFFPDGKKISQFEDENKKTERTEQDGNFVSEVVTENEGAENEIKSTTILVNGHKQTVIHNKGNKTTSTINYNGDKKSDETIVGKNSTTVITYDSEGNPAKEVETSGTTEKTYTYNGEEKVLTTEVQNKGIAGKEICKTYNADGGYTQTQNVASGVITTVADKDGNITDCKKTETINGQEVTLQLDKDGNIPGVIVQNGESPAAIAKKFGCSVDDLVKLNQDQLKGKGKNQYFDVGSEIKLPNTVGIEKFQKAQEGRKPAEVAKAEYKRDAEIRQQKAAEAKQKAAVEQQEREYYKKLGVKNFNNKGEKVKADGWGNKEFEVIGDVGYGRQLVKRDGKLYTRSHDGKILREDYLQAHKAFVSKPENQRNNTASGIKDVTYVKDNNGKVWYFDEKTGKAIVKGNYTQIVKQESAFVANQLHTAAKGMGTDEELLEQGVKNIYSRDILQGVNAELKTKDTAYAGDTDKMPVEALILDEMSHGSARPLLKTLIDSGTMTAQEQARTVKRELEHEVHGGFGITKTADVNEVMQMVGNREVRLELEKQFNVAHPELEANDASFVRTYLAGDGFDAQEVDRFDANWVKTGAYQEARYVKQTDENGVEVLDANGQPVYVRDEGDQAHRNGVIGRLVFDYQDKEALNKGLDAVNENPNSFDYQYLDQRAGEEIAKDPQGKYQSRFTNQDNVQRYLAGFHSDSNGNVDAGNVSASNTCLFKGIKPARVQAEEALYNAKNGDYSQTFDSIESETYTAMAELVENGDIKGVKKMTDLYNKALESTKGTTKQQLVKGNAILSGQVQFSDKEIADYCIELMHSIDNNRGTAASSDVNSKSMTNGLGGYTNLADTQTEQLKAILQANPQILQSVKQQVKNGKFESVSHVTAGIQTKSFAEDTKGKYLALIADTKSIAKDEIFLDTKGNKITDPTQIKAIKEANMQSLDAMRQYVAELERDFKKGVDAEGTLSNMGNAVLEASGWGTDRSDVANEYRNAKLMLSQFEAAAQGKLRDSQGKVVSAQDLAQQIMNKQNALAQTNSDYKQSVSYAKMGIVMAPVIVATAGAGAAVGVAGGAATAAGMTTTGAILSSNTTIAIASGLAAGATTYGVNAIEYNTSYTGNTAEAREQNLEDSIVNGATTAIGIGQMKYIGNMANNMGTVARTGIRLGTTVAADTGVGVGAEYATTGNVSTQGTMSNMIMSGVGNAIGAKSLGKKQPTPNMHPRDGVYLTQDAPITGRNEIADAQVARNIDQSHLNGRDRQMVAKEMEAQATPTSQELDEYAKEMAYKAPTAEERAALDAHQEQVRADYADAHKIENNATIKEQKAPTPILSADETAIKNLENEIGALDGQIKQLNRQLEGAKKFNQMGRKNGDTIKKLESQIESLRQKRGVKSAELDAVKNPVDAVAEVKPNDDVEVKQSADETPTKNVEEKPTAEEPVTTPVEEKAPVDTHTEKSLDEQISDLNNQIETAKKNGQSTIELDRKLDELKAKRASEIAKSEVDELNAEAPIISDEAQLSALEKEVKDLDAQIESLNKQIETAKKNGQSTAELDKKLDDLKMKRAEKIGRSETIEVGEDVAPINEPTPIETPKVEPQEVVNVVNEIPEAQIPAQHRSLWKSCKAQISNILKELSMPKIANPKALLAKGKALLNDIRTIATSVGISAELKAKLQQLSNKIKTMFASKNLIKTNNSVKVKHVETVEEAEKLYDQMVLNRSEYEQNKNSNLDFSFPNGWAQATYGGKAPKQGTQWKIHIYADGPQEWANVAQVAIPYLENNKIGFKTVSGMNHFNRNRNNTQFGANVQTGKSFTVYFENEEQFVQTAKALEARFKESGLKSSGTVKNEAQIGDSGFLSYRHEGAERGTQYKPDGVEDPYLKSLQNNQVKFDEPIEIIGGGAFNSGERGSIVLDLDTTPKPKQNVGQFDEPIEIIGGGAFNSGERGSIVLDLDTTPNPKQKVGQFDDSIKIIGGGSFNLQLSTQQKITIGEIGQRINGIRFESEVRPLQAKIDRLPDCPQKTNLQRQLTQKQREIVVADSPSAISRTAPKPTKQQMIEMEKMSAEIAQATTSLELEDIQARLEKMPNCAKKRELHSKLNQKIMDYNDSVIDKNRRQENSDDYYNFKFEEPVQPETPQIIDIEPETFFETPEFVEEPFIVEDFGF